MIKENKLLILNTISKGGSVRKLIHEGLTFKKISLLLEKLVDENFLIYKDEKIKLTDQGAEFLKGGFDLIKKSNKKLWIKPEERSKILKIREDFIFLPLQSELDF